MAKKMVQLSDKDYRIIGSRHGSSKVARETSDAHARWNRDAPKLGSYGQGRPMFAEFEELRTQHVLLCKDHGDVVAAKQRGVRERDEAVSASWKWIDQVSGILVRFTRKDAALAERYNNNLPADDSRLATGIGGLSGLLADVQPRCVEDDQVPARLAEVEPLLAKLNTLPGLASAGKVASVQDTAEIDVLDGKLYVMMRDLNEAARKAIRNGDLDAPLADYRFHYLNRSGRSRKEENDPTPVTEG